MATRTLDLNLLPIAFALYDELSVSRAARVLGMSQPAVSMLVSILHLYGIDQWLDDKGKAMTDKLGSSTGRLQPLEIV